MKENPQEWSELGSFKSYLLGFILSVVLTIAAYLAVVRHTFSGKVLLFVILGVATLQMLVQFIFFLHLGKESKPRWNMMIFLFMLLIVGILVVGSLWIMSNLDYRMMPPMDMHEMRAHEGI
jgi:cytochrome o ubiquinol oxidase subunit IV